MITTITTVNDSKLHSSAGSVIIYVMTEEIRLLPRSRYDQFYCSSSIKILKSTNFTGTLLCLCSFGNFGVKLVDVSSLISCVVGLEKLVVFDLTNARDNNSQSWLQKLISRQPYLKIGKE